MLRRVYIVGVLMLLCSGMAILAWYALYRPSRGIELGRLTLWHRITVFDAEAYGLSADSELDGVSRAEIANEATDMIVADVTYHRGRRLWKGSLLGSVTLVDGTTENIRISYYGGFFKVVGQSGYYQTHRESRRKLETIIKTILAEEFIPERATKKQSIDH